MFSKRCTHKSNNFIIFFSKDWPDIDRYNIIHVLSVRADSQLLLVYKIVALG